MNRQEAFDTVCDHLRTQGCRAVNIAGQCRYRGRNGTKCAIGALIDDEHYTADIESFGPSNSGVVRALTRSGITLQEGDITFLDALQGLHDTLPGEAFHDVLEGRLQRLAASYRLEYAAP